MAPASASSAGNATPTAFPINPQPTVSSEFAGDEFSNNLFSDLAPILTLFGEQVTKQFLSMSLGWADNILLAVGPLGIVTTIVSVIRVANIRALKALVGRAREKLALAELELLSSTSNDTCELWTEEGVVRQPGHAHTLELVVHRKDAAKQKAAPIKQEDFESGPDVLEMGDLGDACDDEVLKEDENHRSALFGPLLQKLGIGTHTPPRFTPEQLAMQPPNLALNIHGALASDKETWMFVGLGVAMQIVALLIPAVMTYHWKTKKGDNPIPGYAYPIFLAGSCGLILGMALCSHIIEASTVEQRFRPKDPNRVKTIFRLQMGCNMGDQEFKPYVIINEIHDRDILTSRSSSYVMHKGELSDIGNDPGDSYHVAPSQSLTTAVIEPANITSSTASASATIGAPQNASTSVSNGNPEAASKAKNGTATKTSRKLKIDVQKFKIAFAISISLAGFVGQFVGLRALHWSATIIQLGVTLLMTAIRAWVRRGVSRKPNAIQLPVSDPHWIALTVGAACRQNWPNAGAWPDIRPPAFRLHTGSTWSSALGADTRYRHSQQLELDLLTTRDPRIGLVQKLQARSSLGDERIVRVSNQLFKALQLTVDAFTAIGALKETSFFTGRTGTLQVRWTHLLNTQKADGSDQRHSHLGLCLNCNDAGVLYWEDDNDPLPALLTLLVYSHGSVVIERYRAHSVWCIDILPKEDRKAQLSRLKSWTQSKNLGHRSETQSYPDSEHFQPVFGLSLEAIRSRAITMPTTDANSHALLVAELHYQLPAQCALEIFSGFLDEIAKQLKPRILARGPEVVYVRDFERFLSRMSQGIMPSELFTSIEDAKIMIASSFLRHDLLPLH